MGEREREGDIIAVSELEKCLETETLQVFYSGDVCERVS